MSRFAFVVLALLVAAASAFVLPVALPRAGTLTRPVTQSGVADALASDIDYESQLKTLEAEAKARIKKAFDEATVKSDAESKERWAKLEAEMKEAASNIGL